MGLQLETGSSMWVKVGFILKPMSRFPSSQPGPPSPPEYGTSHHVWNWKDRKAAAEIRIYNLTVFETSKTRWTSPGQRRLATGELLLYSSGEDDAAPRTQRVALMLSFTAQRHSLDGRYTNQGVPSPLSKIRNGRSTWLSNHSLYPNKWRQQGCQRRVLPQTVYCHSELPPRMPKRKFRRSLQDVHSEHGSDVSNHHLLLPSWISSWRGTWQETEDSISSTAPLCWSKTPPNSSVFLNKFQVTQDLLEGREGGGGGVGRHRWKVEGTESVIHINL